MMFLTLSSINFIYIPLVFLTKFSVTLPFHLETRLVPGTGTKSKDQNKNVSLYQYQD